MSTLQACIERYGPEAGPKLHRALKSRAAYKGVSTRRRRQIEALTGRPYRVRRRAATAALTLPLMPEPATSGADAPSGREGTRAESHDGSPCPLNMGPWNWAPSRN